MADTTNRIYEVVHTAVEIKIVRDYIFDPGSPAFLYKEQSEEFLLVKNLQGKTNREVIESTYTTEYEKKTYKGQSTAKLLLKVGTRLAIEQQKINREGLLTQGIEVASNNVNAFKAKALADLESKEGYAPIDSAKPTQGRIMKGSVKQQFPDMTVWIWCRSLITSGDNNGEGLIFNVTPFVQKLSTSVSRNGGNFQITLPPLVAEKTAPTAELPEGQWIVKKDSILFYQNQKNASLQGAGFVSDNNLYSQQTGVSDPGNTTPEIIRNQFLFHNIIGTNDLVFIRFETLQTEVEDRVKDLGSLYVPKRNLPGKIYDMIGLVSNNSFSLNPASTDVSIDISGMDLTKLFIEDGAYFFNLELSQGMIGGPGSAANKNSLIQRLATDQALSFLSLYQLNGIERIFQFVMNQLSHIKVIPDAVLNAYGDRRNHKFIQNNDDTKFSKNDAAKKRYKEIAIQNITEIRAGNELNDVVPTIEKQRCESIFIEYKRFMKALRDNKVRKSVSGTTVGWNQFQYLNDRNVYETIPEDQYPQYMNNNIYDTRATRAVPEGVNIDTSIDLILDIEASETNKRDTYDKEIAPGVWAIIKLVIDQAVSNRRPIDVSLSTANGSLINFFRKACQEPFVEYYADTYGDMFYLIIRKPPTDQIGITSMLQSKVITEEGISQDTRPVIIDIEADDVLSETLFFTDDEAYSWYHFTPQANLIAGASSFTLSYLPAVFLPEYADIWGSRPMDLCHNYLPMMPKDPNNPNNTSQGMDIALRQAVEDMKYVVESNQYLPFTRKGSIKVNGDRRLKYGNYIRYKPTGEIFKVEGVKQDFAIGENQIDRTTSIEVSRGMVEQLIYGVPFLSDKQGASTKLISYFTIVNTELNFEERVSTRIEEKQVKVGRKPTNYAQPKGDETTPEPPSPYAKFASDKVIIKGNIGLYKLEAYSPEQKKRWVQFINAINAEGWIVDITSGKRSFSQQAALKRQNEKNAAPGHSKHGTGQAIDLNIIHLKTGKRLTKVDDIILWLGSHIPQIGRALFIRWGGQDFKDYYDPIHFELSGGSAGAVHQATEYEDVYETQKIAVKEKGIDTNKIFSNFKVDVDVLNFFLRREQFSKEYLVAKNQQQIGEKSSASKPNELSNVNVIAKFNKR